MATTYHYYYIGDEEQYRDAPALLTFSKVKNGPMGENKAHSHTYLEIFAFLKAVGDILKAASKGSSCGQGIF